MIFTFMKMRIPTTNEMFVSPAVGENKNIAANFGQKNLLVFSDLKNTVKNISVFLCFQE